MKRKILLTVLAMCVVLTAAACGNENKVTEKRTEASGTEQNGEDAAEIEEKKESRSASDTRLVSVKNIDDYIKIAEYKGIDLEVAVQQITEQDIQNQIDYDLEENPVEVSDGAQMGDLVTVNFVGTKDGVAFDGGTANNYDMVLGEAYMIDGFEDGIVGMKKGETRELNLTFPEDYYVESLAGQPVVFKVTVQTVRRTAELNDEWIVSMGAANEEEYRANVKAQLEEEAAETAEDNAIYTAWQELVNASEIIEFPQDDIDTAMGEYKEIIEDYAAQADMEMDAFLESQGYTTEEFESQCQEYAEMKVKQNLIVQGIMDKEGLGLDDEECLAFQNDLVENFGVQDLAELIDLYGQVAVDESIGLMRVEKFILDHANRVEEAAEGDAVVETE